VGSLASVTVAAGWSVREPRNRLGPSTHHVDDYSVLSLDDLVVTIVEDTLAPPEG
jgi:hypothetical protein